MEEDLKGLTSYPFDSSYGYTVTDNNLSGRSFTSFEVYWPLEVGKEWRKDFEDGVYEHIRVLHQGVIQTTAGTFDNGYELQDSTNLSEAKFWICAGVGPVLGKWAIATGRGVEARELQTIYRAHSK